MRTDPVRTEMRCKKAMRASRHAGCVSQRRVLRETSQHATLNDRNPAPGQCHRRSGLPTGECTTPSACDNDVSVIRTRAEPSRIHLLLTVPPSFWAAFFMQGRIYAVEHMDVRERRYAGTHLCRGALEPMTRIVVALIAGLSLAACASEPPKLPLPRVHPGRCA